MGYKEKKKYLDKKGQNEIKRGIIPAVCRDPCHHLEPKCKKLTEEFVERGKQGILFPDCKPPA